MYAHVQAEGGQLALQYWLYYVFDDFNNKHESDWEKISSRTTSLVDGDRRQRPLGGCPARRGIS